VVDVSFAVLKLSQRNSQLEAEHARSQHDRDELRTKCDALRHQNEELVMADTGKMDVDEHINALAVVKQYVLVSQSCSCCIIVC